jgi:hypothetical protein
MKPFRAFEFSNHTWMEGVALSSVCGLAYYAVFLLQTKLSSLVNFAQGIDLFFAPAGIKLVAFMVAGIWGFWGIAVVGLITAQDVWQKDTLWVHLGNTAIWAGVPYVTYLALAQLLRLDASLMRLKYWHVLIIALATSLASSFGSNLYQWLVQNRSFDMITSASIAMAVGDFMGIGVFVFAIAFIVKKRSQRDTRS